MTSTGAPYVWSTATPIAYRTDNGPLSATVTEAQAQARVLAMFNVWENVPTSNIDYDRAGFISNTGAFTGGDVDTVPEYDAVDASCNNGVQSPIIYDATAVIFIDLGLDETSVIGFAGPCSFNATQIVSGKCRDEWAISGRRQCRRSRFDGSPSLTPHLSMNLGISLVSTTPRSMLNCRVSLLVLRTRSCWACRRCSRPLLDASQGVLQIDDIAWISRLYPQTAGANIFREHAMARSPALCFSPTVSHMPSLST